MNLLNSIKILYSQYESENKDLNKSGLSKGKDQETLITRKKRSYYNKNSYYF